MTAERHDLAGAQPGLLVPEENLPAGAPNCWFYGANNACGTFKISTCPNDSRAPWGDYAEGDLNGYYNLWVR